MANTRFILANLAESAVVANGAAGGPARLEYAPFVMERALNRDRNSVWKLDGFGGGIALDLDFGSAVALTAGAVLGLKALDGGSWTQCNIWYSSTYYPAAVTWTAASSNSFSADPARRNFGASWGSVSRRYWRVELALAAAPKLYTIGRVVLGVLLDLGIEHSPSGGVSPFQNRVEQGLADGSFNINTLGDPGSDIILPFNSVPAATRTMLESVAAATGSVVLLDNDGKTRECLVRGGRARESRPFTGLYDVSLELAELP